jgi:hypothetical protein
MKRKKGMRIAVVGAAFALLAGVGVAVSPWASAQSSFQEKGSRVEGSRCWIHYYEFHTTAVVKGKTRGVDGQGITDYCGDGNAITENHRNYCSKGSYTKNCGASANQTLNVPFFDVVAQWSYCDDSVDSSCGALKVGYVVNRYYPNGTFERINW